MLPGSALGEVRRGGGWEDGSKRGGGWKIETEWVTRIGLHICNAAMQFRCRSALAVRNCVRPVASRRLGAFDARVQPIELCIAASSTEGLFQDLPCYT